MQDSTRLLLVRHAQHDASADDGLLTAVGEAQAGTLGPALGVDAGDVLVASSLRRAIATARAIRSDVEVLPELDEFRFGDGAPTADELIAERADLALWRPEHGYPGGETLRSFDRRVGRAMERLASEHTGRAIVVVTHSGVIDAALRWAFGLTPRAPWVAEARLPNASITELEHWPRGRHAGGSPRFTVLHRIGDVAHVPPGLVTEI